MPYVPFKPYLFQMDVEYSTFGSNLGSQTKIATVLVRPYSIMSPTFTWTMPEKKNSSEIQDLTNIKMRKYLDEGEFNSKTFSLKKDGYLSIYGLFKVCMNNK